VKELIKEVRAKRDDTVWRYDEQHGRMTLVATTTAFAALGIDPRDAAEDVETEVARKDSKQAQLIAMLRRAKGATIDEIAETLEWQPHTVRGAIAGALKKKLGLDVTSEKDEKRGRLSHRELSAARPPPSLA
jgi:hypothetical protein